MNSTHLEEACQQKQLSRGILRERCAENMLQIYKKTPMLKCEVALPHGCSPVNLLHIFIAPFHKNIPGGLLLYLALY